MGTYFVLFGQIGKILEAGGVTKAGLNVGAVGLERRCNGG